MLYSVKAVGRLVDGKLTIGGKVVRANGQPDNLKFDHKDAVRIAAHCSKSTCIRIGKSHYFEDYQESTPEPVAQPKAESKPVQWVPEEEPTPEPISSLMVEIRDAVIELGLGEYLTRDRDWLWLTFPEKPAREVLNAIGRRGLGFWWRGKRGAWSFDCRETVDA